MSYDDTRIGWVVASLEIAAMALSKARSVWSDLATEEARQAGAVAADGIETMIRIMRAKMGGAK